MPQSSASRYYFDANALFKFYQNEVGSLKIRRLVARVESPILLSPLTVLECFGIAVKRHRQRQFRTGQVKQMFKHFQKDVRSFAIKASLWTPEFRNKARL